MIESSEDWSFDAEGILGLRPVKFIEDPAIPFAGRESLSAEVLEKVERNLIASLYVE